MLLGVRTVPANFFDIQYFPRDDAQTEDRFSIADTLMDAMDFVALSDGVLIRGSKRSCEIMNGVLHFFVQYHWHLIEPQAMQLVEPMDEKRH